MKSNGPVPFIKTGTMTKWFSCLNFTGWLAKAGLSANMQKVESRASQAMREAEAFLLFIMSSVVKRWEDSKRRDAFGY
jgi:hypothetical protein